MHFKSMSLSQRGFSLVELLIVIAIIGVLIALTLPALDGARETARRTLCGSNLRQFYYALAGYDQENRALPPGVWNYGNNIGQTTHKVLRDEYNVTAKAITCPSAARIPVTTFVNWNANNVRINLTYWYLAGNAGRPSTAGNEANGWTNSLFPSKDAGYYPPLSFTKAYAYPANKVETWKQPIMADIAYWRQTGTMPTTQPQRANHADAQGYNAVGQNMLFADGHLEWQRPELGKTWKYYGTLYVNSNMWINSSFEPPAAPNVFYFN